MSEEQAQYKFEGSQFGMNISTLYEMQKVLDAKIIKEKGLEGQNLLPNTVLALQVELGELANEWRGFKHWSKDQEPRYERKCHACNGIGGFILGDGPEDSEMCLYCEGTGIEARPLLEEYVDCLHFFLSIARQLNIEPNSIVEYRLLTLHSDTSEAMIKIINRVGVMSLKHNHKEESWLIAWSLFLKLGRERFDFTWEEIYQGYLDKNKVNHERQANGY